MNVREATPADEPTVLAFTKAIFAENWDRPWPQPEVSPALFEGRLVLLAEDDGEAVGYAFGEYQSVPEYFRPLPPGDVVALGANPTVVSRLTGAEPGRVRAVARTADSPHELPPADELLQQIAELMGL